ncbi:hypothetical protein TKK_0002989 [Trichogramma kaykai]
MDDFVKNFLIENNLHNLHEKFEKAGIDKSVFEELDEEMLTCLFEKHECGFRKRFQKAYDAWKIGSPIPSNSIDKVHSTLSDSQSNSNETTISQNNLPLTTEPNYRNISQTSDSADSLVPVILTGFSQEFPFDLPPIKKSVRELLNSTLPGKIILTSYAKNMKIETSLLSELLIMHEFSYTENYCIEMSTLIDLSKEIGAIFASEQKSAQDIEILFAHVPENGNTCTGGILYDKYYNTRRVFKHYGLIVDNDEEGGKAPTQFANETVSWLQNNSEPFETVKTKWIETFSQRERCKNPKKYFLTYVCLSTSSSHLLFASDFDLMFP